MTLVEVICSLAILGIIIAPTAAFFANSFKTNNFAKEQMEANQLSQKYMEEYKGKSYTRLLEIIEDGGTETPPAIGIQTYTTNVEIVNTSTPSVITAYDVEFSIDAMYSGKELKLDAVGLGVTVYDGGTVIDSKTHASHDPITVIIRQTGTPTADITLKLNNATTAALQVTKRKQDEKIVLTPVQGKIATVTQEGEATAESLTQEAGITITVTVSRQSDGFELAKFRQIKMTN